MTSTPAAPRRRFGPYEVIALLGTGGMGAVYRARDARLGRDVALKVIALDVSAHPGRLRRFEQEARALAALNHPHILAVYDVGAEEGTPYVVLELLEGETLRDRLEREAVPARKAVDWAVQIARGLAAAHEAGIVHRDLKPGNVFVTKDGRVKILDFGLAKLLLGEETAGGDDGRPPRSTETTPGELVGTTAYMAPEQVRGQAVDARADLFALGAVLYEMLWGRRAFRGDTNADTLTAILKEEPPGLGAPPPAVSSRLARIVRRCLEKNAGERFQSARDLAFYLESLEAPDGAALDAGRAAPPWRALAAAAVLMTAVAAAAFFAGRRGGPLAGATQPAALQGEARFRLTLPAGVIRARELRFSPDGTQLAFVGSEPDGRTQLWVHSLRSLEARPLPGTEDVRGRPFWSPDGRSLGFFTLDNLRRIDVSGGQPQTLSEVPSAYDALKSGAWNGDGTVIVASGVDVMHRVPASGGQSMPVTRLDENGERYPAFPEFLPDGRHFLYFSRGRDLEHQNIRVAALDTMAVTPLMKSEASGTYAWPGYLLVRRRRTLMAHPFDATRLALGAGAVPVAEDVDVGGFSASDTNVLAYASSPPDSAQLTWFDRAGGALGTVGEPAPYNQLALSPDRRYAAVQRLDTRLQTYDIWLLDIARGALTRFTSDPGSEVDPVWSPDGRRIAFSARQEGIPRLSIFQKAVGGPAAQRVLPESVTWAFAEDWSRDGRFILYGAGIGGSEGIWAAPADGNGSPVELVKGTGFNDEAQVSPDGRFLAYMSYQSGRFEVYVQRFSEPTTRVRVSTEGGQQPRWRADGRELFYVSADGMLMVAEMSAGPSPEPGIPRKLFGIGRRFPTFDAYAVTSDGQRFLVLAPAPDAEPSKITVVLNWTAGLKSR